MKDMDGALINRKFWGRNLAQWNGGYMDYANTKHPLTAIQMEKGWMRWPRLFRMFDP